MLKSKHRKYLSPSGRMFCAIGGRMRRYMHAAIQREYFQKKFKKSGATPSMVQAEQVIPLMESALDTYGSEGYIAKLAGTHREIDQKRRTSGPTAVKDEKVVQEMMKNAAALSCARRGA